MPDHGPDRVRETELRPAINHARDQASMHYDEFLELCTLYDKWIEGSEKPRKRDVIKALALTEELMSIRDRYINLLAKLEFLKQGKDRASILRHLNDQNAMIQASIDAGHYDLP